MKLIIRILISACIVLLLAYLLPGVGVTGYGAAILVAIVLALLNAIIKPILVILTIPITIITLGLFLLVINALIILMADEFVSGFSVNGFWTALLFSILLSICQSIVNSTLKEDKK